jgi:hypothetical protein
MSDRKPDVEISASVRAKELRFECKPDVEIGISGEPAVSGGSVSERENLPDELEPGETYRDFAVRWRLAARLEDLQPEDK